jgi:hypothetical protein
VFLNNVPHNAQPVRLLGLSRAAALESDQDMSSVTNQDFVCGQMTAVTSGVMFWGAISFGIRSPFVFVPGILNTHRCIHNVLEPVLVPFIQTLPNGIFQQDNARPQTTNLTRTYLQQAQLQMFPWPARSSDADRTSLGNDGQATKVGYS